MDFETFKDTILGLKDSEQINDYLKSIEGDYRKAVTTDHKLGSDPSAIGLDPLKLENLSAFMASVVADNQTIKLAKRIKSVPTDSNIYEIPRHLSHGDWYGQYGNFGEQLGLGDNKRTNHDRPRINIKYHVQNREVSIAQSLVKLYGGGNSSGSIGGVSYNNALQIETTSGLQDMAIIKNKTFWFGNESVDPNACNGILELHKRQGAGGAKLNPEDYSKLTTVFDLRGAKLTYGKLNEINRSIMSKWGMADTFIGAPSIVDDLSSADLLDFRRLIQDNNKVLDNVTVGQEITTFKTQLGGRMDLAWDFHIERHIEGTGTGENYGDSWKIGDANQKIRTDAPAIPNVAAGTNVPAADALSKFAAGDAGDYFYAVAAVGEWGGQSKLALINAVPATVAAGQSVDLTFVDGAGATPTKGYVIYRSLKNAPTSTGYFYPIAEVTVTELANGYDGAVATKIRDRNRTLTKTQDACMFFNDTRIIHSPELLPITRVPLARIQLSDKFALANFYALAMPTPQKIAIVRNIG